MRPRVFLGIVGLVFLLSLAGCEKKSGMAVVLEKEHIAAMAIPPKNEQGARPGKSTENDDTKVAELGKDDITVDTYVMNKNLRGTDRDPRAVDREQWLVKVRMIDDGRQFNVQAEKAQFDRLKEGDRVKVSYRVGKYTGTVWDSEIR